MRGELGKRMFELNNEENYINSTTTKYNNVIIFCLFGWLFINQINN